MTDADVQIWRRQRLEELAKLVGGHAPLGRKLGYKDGAYIGQMIKGHRPITEKTVLLLETVRDAALGISGARGWFAQPATVFHAAEPTAVPVRYQQLIADLDDLPPSRRSVFLDQIHQAAQEAREAAEHLNRRQSSREHDRVMAAARRPPTSRTYLTYGDGNPSQQPLPLATVADPFTAEPDEREVSLYRRIQRAPKT